MNYEQIKGYVVRVDSTLELVPIDLLETLLGEVQGAPYVDLWALHDIELPHDVDVPGIQCVVHSLMELDTYCYYEALIWYTMVVIGAAITLTICGYS